MDWSTATAKVEYMQVFRDMDDALTLSVEHLEEIVRDFHREAHVKHGVERIVCARVGDLIVQEINWPFEIRETEGSERVVDVSHRRNISI